MRNLVLCGSVRVGDAPELSHAQHVCVDYDTKDVYVVTASAIFTIAFPSQEVTQRVSLSEYLASDGQVVGAVHLPDQMSVCIAAAQGDVLLWNTTTDQLECVGSVGCGITAMQWSPDHEVITLTTGEIWEETQCSSGCSLFIVTFKGENKLVMMTREFDIISETDLSPGSFGEAEFINVGWGKKETQFHGMEGKEAAKVKVKTARAAFDWDDRRPRITWQGDGQFFAVTMVHPQTGCREVRVWTREGSLHSSSEILDGLEQALCWRPSGGFLAASQRKPNKHDIVFIERNGLKHREFTLPVGVNDLKVREILWNNDSSVLAVWCENLAGSQPTKSCVQLWTTGNYHWYLKQHLEFSFGQAEFRIAAVCWDPEHAYRLHVVCENGQYVQYTWSWSTAHSLGQSGSDQALVAVVDGAQLLMTPFHSMVVPPPMCAYQLRFDSPVHQVAFCAGQNANQFLVLLADDQVALYKFTEGEKSVDGSVECCASGGNGFKVMCPTPSRIRMLSIEGSTLPPAQYPGRLTHLNFVDDRLVTFVTLDLTGSTSLLHRAVVDPEVDVIRMEESFEVHGVVMTTAVNPSNQHLVLQLTDGTLLDYGPGESHSLRAWTDSSGREICLPQPCVSMAVCQMAGEDAVLGLTDRFRFFANDLEVANNCTSFAVHADFLLLTTHSHTCRCISRKVPIHDLPSLSDGKAHPFDESVRRVERGSRVVCVVPGHTKLVLQMPRGNLEVIHPRALVLSSVRGLIDSLQFGEAFQLMRRHRINMNLLHDHSPKVFCENVKTFIEQIEAVNHINLFLTDLQEEDVTETMYTGAYHRPSGGSMGARKIGKVDAVCDAVRSVLQELDPERYLLSVLTAYVKKSTPQLEEALRLIKRLREEAASGPGVSAEEALRYLLFLVDVNELYDVALGTYDFDLVMMVAEKSQKDPKEYLPFLNHLRKMESNYQRYSIDLHLKRYSSALQHVVKCGRERFEECLLLVKQQKLFTQALALYPVDCEEYKEIALAFGQHLMEDGRFEEAGLIYARSKQFDLALESFERAHHWRQCMCLAEACGLAPEKVVALVHRLVAHLKERRLHAEAALLLDQYTNEHEEAIALLIEGCQWDEALRMMYKHKRTDFIESDLRPGVVESHRSLMSLLENAQDQFERNKSRLQVVREEKEQKRHQLLESGEDVRPGALESDLFSDTSSATGESVISRRTTDSQVSSASKMSGKSAKNKRKAERKKWSLKEGSRFEDLALVEVLHGAYAQTNDWIEEVGHLLRVLTLLHYDQEATCLQDKMAAWTSLLAASIGDIWPEDTSLSPLESAMNTLSFGPNTTANALAEALQQQNARRPPTEPMLDPVLRQPPVLKKASQWKLSMI